MRLILTILLIGLLKAEGQMVISASQPYRPLLTGFLLDDYPNAAAAYSLRKLRTGYTGSAIRVRKDTTGQPEQDIGFTNSGDLDTAAIKTFLNARNGWVTVFYDQSGNSRNATQTIQANQPQIAALGVINRMVGEPSILFNGSYHFVQSLIATNPQQLAFSLVGRADGASQVFWAHRDAATNLIQVLSAGTGTNLQLDLRSSTSARIQINNGITFTTPFYSFLQFDNVNFRHNLWVNNVAGTENNTNFGGNFNSTKETIAGTDAGTGVGSRLSGRISELIIWQSDQTANRTGIQNNTNSYYGIY